SAVRLYIRMHVSLFTRDQNGRHRVYDEGDAVDLVLSCEELVKNVECVRGHGSEDFIGEKATKLVGIPIPPGLKQFADLLIFHTRIAWVHEDGAAGSCGAGGKRWQASGQRQQ